jgi:hypothetical protein
MSFSLDAEHQAVRSIVLERIKHSIELRTCNGILGSLEVHHYEDMISRSVIDKITWSTLARDVGVETKSVLLPRSGWDHLKNDFALWLGNGKGGGFGAWLSKKIASRVRWHEHQYEVKHTYNCPHLAYKSPDDSMMHVRFLEANPKNGDDAKETWNQNRIVALGRCLIEVIELEDRRPEFSSFSPEVYKVITEIRYLVRALGHSFQDGC